MYQALLKLGYTAKPFSNWGVLPYSNNIRIQLSGVILAYNMVFSC